MLDEVGASKTSIFGLLLSSLYSISGKKVIVLIDEYNSKVIKKFLTKKNNHESKYNTKYIDSRDYMMEILNNMFKDLKFLKYI